jgi:ABC-type transporter Mla MlaB component
VSNAKLQALGGGRWHLEGSLTIADVGDLADGPVPSAPAGGAVELDLGGVHHSSSAAVALLLEWRQRIGDEGGSLRLLRCPDALVRIATLSNCAALLGLRPVADQKTPPVAEAPDG